ncbi:vacuolar protein sorting-associated protein 37A-like [Rhincodon typus]|uniref:vacuolar protein sorting-associated protein 37A-like n=1 Tax=Rhincodon typus TaxID=259920 RepID=UPI002030D02F|nr:vacuolar protein sorting-associated protein 37A-like [Rhincodon typus]
MNWIFPSSKGSGSGSGHLPPLTSLQQQRQRQIESVKSSHNSIVEIQKDVEYRLPFTVNNKTINLNIFLPPQFPQEKPVITVFPPVRHHLVDLHSATYVKSPLITNMFFEDHIDDAKYCGHLYGLGSGSSYVQNGTGNAYEEEANKQQP